MSVLTRGRCKAGRHSGEWWPPDGRCRTFRTCDSCGKAEEKTLHAWGQFDYSPLTDATKVTDANDAAQQSPRSDMNGVRGGTARLGRLSGETNS